MRSTKVSLPGLKPRVTAVRGHSRKFATIYTIYLCLALGLLSGVAAVAQQPDEQPAASFTEFRAPLAGNGQGRGLGRMLLTPLVWSPAFTWIPPLWNTGSSATPLATLLRSMHLAAALQLPPIKSTPPVLSREITWTPGTCSTALCVPLRA